MYTTKEAIAKNTTIEDILSRVTEMDIYKKYLGDFAIGRIYKSPFRDDKNPSFGVFRGRDGHLLFKDHGSGVCGGIVKFVGELYSLAHYSDIIEKLCNDMNISSRVLLPKHARKPIPQAPLETVIGVVKQDYTQQDKDYWGRFGITIKTLRKFKVSSIKYYLCNGIVKGIYKPENPMYAYHVYDKFKIYRPLGSKYTKWRNNLTEFDIQGYEQLPKNGDLLLITKSLKDIMTLHEMGYTAISPSSESTFIPQAALDDVLKRFKRVIILFDRDAAGVRQSRLESLKTGLRAMFVHKKFKAKDISDAVEANGMEVIKTWLNNTL